jgi:heat shock protein HspQ
MELHFTKEEMIDFLKKEGFTIKSIKTWSSYNTYHNQVENNNSEMVVAYIGEINEFNNSEKEYRKDSVEKYQVKNVFQTVLKSKLLGL